MIFVTSGSDHISYLMSNPPPEWKPSAVLFLSYEMNFQTTYLIDTNFGYKTEKATAISPHSLVTQNGTYKFYYQLFSFYPFNRNTSNLIGKWDKLRMTSMEDIFPNRFMDFNNEIIHVSSDVYDLPIVYQDEEGNHAGISINILQTLADIFNFRLTYTNHSSDGTFIIN